MTEDDFWITRFSDNRVKSVLTALREAIADCENPEVVYKLRGTLSVGFANFAAFKERELRSKAKEQHDPR